MKKVMWINYDDNYQKMFSRKISQSTNTLLLNISMNVQNKTFGFAKIEGLFRKLNGNEK